MKLSTVSPGLTRLNMIRELTWKIDPEARFQDTTITLSSPDKASQVRDCLHNSDVPTRLDGARVHLT